MDESVEEVGEDDRGQNRDRIALRLSPASNANSSMRLELALALANREMRSTKNDEAVTEVATPLRPPEEFVKSSVDDCAKELPTGDPDHIALYHKYGKGRMERVSFGRFFKPWKWRKKRRRMKQQQHQVAATLAKSYTAGTNDLEMKNASLTKKSSRASPSIRPSNKKKALIHDLERKLATKQVGTSEGVYCEEPCFDQFLAPKDLSDNEDEKHRLSIECNCQKNDRTGKVNHLSSGPSATMASSEAASFSRPKSITVDNTSKGGNKRSTRWLLCYPSGGTNGSDSPSPRSESANSNASTPSPTDHGFKMPNSYSNERPTSLPVALLNATARNLDEGEMFNPLSIDPNERVTPQHRLSIAQSVAGLSIDHRSCGTTGRIAHFDNCTRGAFVVTPVRGDDNSSITEEINIITLSDVGLIPPPPMFGGPPKTGVGEEVEEDAEVEVTGMVKPMFEDDAPTGLDDNMDDNDDVNGSSGENEGEDVTEICSEYTMQQASAEGAGVINSQLGDVVGVNTRIIQTVPAKEPQFDAIPLKSALKKHMSSQQKHMTRHMTQKTPTQETDSAGVSTMSEARDYARFQSQNDSSTR